MICGVLWCFGLMMGFWGRVWEGFVGGFERRVWEGELVGDLVGDLMDRCASLLL